MAYTTINKGTDYFNAQTWAGNDGSDRAMTTSFQPDWVWIKATDGTQDHQIYDAVRGATKDIHSNNTDAEGTTTNGLKSFTSTGFTIGGDAGVNDVSLDYVGWSWKAGNSSGSSNSDGDITSTVSANTTAGFSIVKHTGNGSTATIGHGLGAVPKMIFSRKTTSDNWFTYHHILGNGKYMLLEASDTVATSSNVWNDTTPTSSVFTKGGPANENAATYISYCFAEKVGYSKFGDYTGNGSTDGPFIYTGFKPAFVVVKNTSASANWVNTDNAISFNGKGSNESTCLFPSSNSGESDAYGLQLYSNGFAFKGGDSASVTVNGSGNIYIYWAFAEVPLVGTNGIPATAR